MGRLFEISVHTLSQMTPWGVSLQIKDFSDILVDASNTYIAFNSVLLVTASKVVRRLLQRTGDMIWKPLSAISRFFTDAVRKISLHTS